MLFRGNYLYNHFSWTICAFHCTFRNASSNFIKMDKNKRFSETITAFQGYTLPEPDLQLAGYSALIRVYDLKVPLPHQLSAVSKQHRKYEEGSWKVFTKRYKPDDTLGAHLTFALKYEGVNLLVLKSLFKKINQQELLDFIHDEPRGRYPRRTWFLYEWLIEQTLPIEDAGPINYVDVIDTKLQYGGPFEFSKRHRVRNNLPGTKEFCPLVLKTEALEAFRKKNLDQQINETLGSVHKDLITRAAAFLLLKDSKASFAIEGESPQQDRAERWGRAIGQAGQKELTSEEFLRLQELVIKDNRFVAMGFRKEGGFVGVHDRVSGTPIPDHISAKWEDVPNLIDGFIKTNQKLTQENFDPVIAAAVLSFSFVFIHPLEDGNGRIHRYLIHHVLSKMNFAPKGLIFPVSAVILERIDEYREVLESYSRPLLDFIEWKATPEGNVDVLNETKDYYRFFDATKQAEFLYKCVEQTVTETLPEEVEYLENHDKMRNFITYRFDMPDKTMENLIGFLRQNDGSLSNRARKKEFANLTNDEVKMLEEAYSEIFG